MFPLSFNLPCPSRCCCILLYAFAIFTSADRTPLLLPLPPRSFVQCGRNHCRKGAIQGNPFVVRHICDTGFRPSPLSLQTLMTSTTSLRACPPVSVVGVTMPATTKSRLADLNADSGHTFYSTHTLSLPMSRILPPWFLGSPDQFV